MTIRLPRAQHVKNDNSDFTVSSIGLIMYIIMARYGAIFSKKDMQLGKFLDLNATIKSRHLFSGASVCYKYRCAKTL